MIIVVFRESHENSYPSESVNEEISNPLQNSELLPPPDRSIKSRGLSKSRNIPTNEKVSQNNNGWHEVIDPALEELLTQVGVFPTAFKTVAESGWTTEQIFTLARNILDEKGPGKGGGILLYRLQNFKPPETDEEKRRNYAEDLKRFGL